MFTVTLSHDVAADVTVALSAASGSATSGSDFGAPPATVTFSANSGAGATQSASVAVTDDKNTEDAENFSCEPWHYHRGPGEPGVAQVRG